MLWTAVLLMGVMAMTESLNSTAPKGLGAAISVGPLIGGVLGAFIYKTFIRSYLPEVLQRGEVKEDMLTGDLLDILNEKEIKELAEMADNDCK